MAALVRKKDDDTAMDAENPFLALDKGTVLQVRRSGADTRTGSRRLLVSFASACHAVRIVDQPTDTSLDRKNVSSTRPPSR